MAHVICEPCIATKQAACVDVCPTDAIHPRQDEPGFGAASQLFIDPARCIDCGLCVAECPVKAILHQDEVPQPWLKFIELNAAHFRSNG